MISIMKKSTVDTYKKTISNMEREIDNLHIELNSVSGKKRREQVLTRMNQEVYDALASKLMRPACPKTDLEAAYSLGVQAVLEQIRLGWVV
jgi:uncharacterized protein YjcR